MTAHLDVVFDGPPGHHGSRLLDCENNAGHSVKAGIWVDRNNGTWALRLTTDDIPQQVTRIDPSNPWPRRDEVETAWRRNHPHCSGIARYLPTGRIVMECGSPSEHPA